MRLDDKVAIVTGAGRGIGRAIALAYAGEGARVIVNDADPTSAQAVVDEIRALGREAMADGHAVGTATAAAELVRSATEGLGGLDVLVNNAGILRDRMAHVMSEQEWDDVITVHLRGTFMTCQAALRYWRPICKDEITVGLRRNRKIVNVTSMAGLRGNVGQANYAAAKMGVVGLTKTLAREAGPFNVNVNAIAPSAITRMTQGLAEKQFAGMSDDQRDVAERMKMERIPLRRFGSPEDIAPAFVFFASSDSDFVTGQILNVDGGWNT